MVRSATTGLRATIFGAYGFVGRYVTGLLGEFVVSIRSAVRGQAHEAFGSAEL
jgi:hypothetical protein